MSPGRQLGRRSHAASAHALSAAALGACLWAVALIAAPPTSAHPHIWIEAEVTFIVDDGKLTAIRHRWTFDDFFSAYLLTEFNGKRHDALAPGTQARLKAEAFANLRDFDYFSYMRRGLDHVHLQDASDFTATVSKGSLSYDFTLPLRDPMPVGDQPIVLGVYEPSYYIDVILEENDPVRFSGATAGACRYEVREDPASAYYYGLIVPKVISIVCNPG